MQDIETIGYPMATPEDLEETADLVKKTGRGILTAQADVREAAQLKRHSDQGLAEFGKVDIVVAQAGIAGMKGTPPLQAWCDVINTNPDRHHQRHPGGPAAPGRGASIIATGSTAALMDAHQKDNPAPTRAACPTWSPNACCRTTFTTWPPNSRCGHPRQRRTPDQLQHRHAAERADV